MTNAQKPPSWVSDPHPSTDDRLAGQRAAKGLLGLLRACLPGDRARTWTYLNAVAKPRKILRRAVNGFARFDHVYDVLREFTGEFTGPFSILEFGTAQGYAFAKLLYATRYLNVEDRVTVHGFDSFEGLPAVENAADKGFIGNDWMKGAYRASQEVLEAHCARERFNNYRLHKGYFEESITTEVVAELRAQQPILVWVDCDMYSSSRTVLERILPILRNGCVVYFDDIDFNFRSRFSGQARLIHEINRGNLGPDVELAVDPELSWDSGRLFRFVRHSDDALLFEPLYRRDRLPLARGIVDGSPFP